MSKAKVFSVVLWSRAAILWRFRGTTWMKGLYLKTGKNGKTVHLICRICNVIDIWYAFKCISLLLVLHLQEKTRMRVIFGVHDRKQLK